MYPTLKSCSISPATADETQTTAATPSTAATPEPPETPSATISSAAISSVESVSPETGLFDEPMNPTRLPDTVAKKNPTTSMTTAARIAGHNSAGNLNVEQAHQHEHDGNQAEHHLRTHVAFGANQLGLLVCRLAQVGEGLANSGGQARSHLEKV